MNVLIATTTATSTLYMLTGQAMDLFNFFIQFLTFFGALFAGLVIMLIVIVIPK